MIVPQFWAEARRQQRTGKVQITLRRFGWSDVSQADAQRHAEQRVEEAVAQAATNPVILRREPKRPYNGADGVPIREEIVQRHGSCVVTRNAYGARCLNTPNVLFADIDGQWEPAWSLYGVVATVSLIAGLALMGGRVHWLILTITVVLGAGMLLVLAEQLRQRWVRFTGGPEKSMIDRIKKFIRRHPDWHVRVYRTPAGLRLLALQRTFSPHDPEVQELFAATGVDPVYRRMCEKQNCFRARVSAKPWRIGIADRLRPRSGAWPVPEDGQPARQVWVEHYEQAAAAYAACQFIESLGSGRIDPAARAVQQLHDELSQALLARPLA